MRQLLSNSMFPGSINFPVLKTPYRYVSDIEGPRFSLVPSKVLFFFSGLLIYLHRWRVSDVVLLTHGFRDDHGNTYDTYNPVYNP